MKYQFQALSNEKTVEKGKIHDVQCAGLPPINEGADNLIDIDLFDRHWDQ